MQDILEKLNEVLPYIKTHTQIAEKLNVAIPTIYDSIAKGQINCPVVEICGKRFVVVTELDSVDWGIVITKKPNGRKRRNEYAAPKRKKEKA